ncbi:glycosyltransferase family 39 protein [Roseibium sp. RKSG952]|uniref:ArnT family glycosyltransferase n=1 Tax=Roseibium sp. RKSG952 TaxID=2529384 RepID=UPI0012BC0255|nr:glycosyltransferase family 39 protein [Roseibium sp. RKSG952]MTH96246.1 glycosyltransferase family 39 protein [Roseibium sp. RKSG952]
MTPTQDTDTNPSTVSPKPAGKPFWLKLFGHDISAPLFLLVLSLFLFVPGQWTVPPLDRDEPRFTQATKQMLETGNYVDIRFQDEARYKKPIGIYWLQAAAAELSGKGADAPLWVYRLPSLIGATMAVLASFWLARAFMGPAGALLAGIFVACAIIVGVEARLAKTDAVLFLTIILAQGALARIWIRRPDKRLWGLGFVFWTALAASVLIKGPVGLMVVGLTVVLLAAMERGIKWFRAAVPLWGFIWFVLLVVPWFVAIWAATDGAFFTEAIGRDLLGKVGQGQESHGAPPLTHLAAMFGTFWPLPAFFLACLPVIWAQQKSPLVIFCFAWFVPSWIVFELVATKLPHYTMPLLPALALPVAAALMDGGGGTRRWLRWVAAVVLALPAVGVAIAAFAGPFFLGNWPSPPGVVLSVFGALLALAAAARIVRAELMKAVLPSMSAAVLVAIGVWGFTGPALTAIWISPRLVAAINDVPDCSRPAVVTSGFNEPSFIFLEGTATRIVSPQDAAGFLAKSGEGCRIAAIESRNEDAFLGAAKSLGVVPMLVSRVEGLNINGGDETDIGLYRAAAPSHGQ